MFEAIGYDLCALLRLVKGSTEQPSAAIFDCRIHQSTPKSSERAGYDGAKRKKGSKAHSALGTLRHLLALNVTPANEQDLVQLEELARQVQEVPEQSVEVAFFNED